ncbi:DUF6311 domain-containing protein [Paenibacillus popilliae]|uniref:Uncharacterized protein n=1 Tax=Paenibacillus popilliae TaxID=78057 RepID=A0ABY3AMH6_PAEPP|nr:DUF6311 domain-containing protein [Paenibacillus sp. SDF0028]TQR43693.1 hypothetical protein C7Y44_16250 [Paenibacillus sp. SDF0028]
MNKNNRAINFYSIFLLLYIGLTFLFVYKEGVIYLPLMLSVSILFLVNRIKVSEKQSVFIGAGLGACFFMFILGVKVLDPQYIDWIMDRGDPAQHFLGWHFFRAEPWTFPIGIINNYNSPIGTMVAYTDSIPILAIIFKIFNSFLPTVFQYLGIWIMICYILQGTFSVLIMQRITKKIEVQILGTLFLVASPIMLWRAYGHEALMAHWLILASVWLWLKPPSRKTSLFYHIFNAVSILIHPYIFIMVYGMYLLKLIDLYVKKIHTKKKIIFSVIFSILYTLFILWINGYFHIKASGSADGYGYYSLNLNSIFNPQGWSKYLITKPNATGGQYEGFNYIGLGGIILSIWTIILLTINTSRQDVKNFLGKHWVLLVGAMIFSIVAISSIVTFNDIILVNVPVNNFVEKVLGIVRASGRLFWPVYYLIFVFMFYILIKNTSARKTTLLLLVVLTVQYADLSPKFNEFNSQYTYDYKWDSKLKDSIWNDIGQKYSKIVFIPPNVNENYPSFAVLAAKYHMAIEPVYVARDNTKKRQQYNDTLMREFSKGGWEKETVYIVDGAENINNVIRNTQKNDVFIDIDGYNVLLPNFKDYRGQHTEIVDKLASVDTISFDKDGNSGGYRKEGWSHQEDNGIWTEGKDSEIYIPTKGEGDKKVFLLVSPLLGGDVKSQVLKLYANNTYVSSVEIREEKEYFVKIPQELITSNLTLIRFELPTANAPKNLGINEDERELALFFTSIRVEGNK